MVTYTGEIHLHPPMQFAWPAIDAAETELLNIFRRDPPSMFGVDVVTVIQTALIQATPSA